MGTETWSLGLWRDRLQEWIWGTKNISGLNCITAFCSFFHISPDPFLLFCFLWILTCQSPTPQQQVRAISCLRYSLRTQDTIPQFNIGPNVNLPMLSTFTASIDFLRLNNIAHHRTALLGMSQKQTILKPCSVKCNFELIIPDASKHLLHKYTKIKK